MEGATVIPGSRKPWRTKPADFLKYWPGKPDHRSPIKSVIVYCVGSGPKICGHNIVLKMSDLPDWSWAEISAHLRCAKCGSIGYVTLRPNWSDVINFSVPTPESYKR